MSQKRGKQLKQIKYWLRTVQCKYSASKPMSTPTDGIDLTPPTWESQLKSL